MQLIYFDESNTLRLPLTPGQQYAELELKAQLDDLGAVSSWSTDIVSALSLAPFDFKAGDLIQTTLQHQCDVNTPGAGYFSVNGKQSEHWGMWTMVGASVKRGPTVDVNVGTYIMHQHSTNWDEFIHHQPVDRTQWHKVLADAPQQVVYDRIYFASSKSYTPGPGQKIRVAQGTAARLQMAVYR